ncbi:hypothetical protein PoB_001019500 [Plakobranchus ocellatus]|uniref:GH18 domain-containing protein n=1 Tax=Plakobranchus ocellatus TaxID=259542 RepID=A0AAV3YKQ6_9GAST|nr:hypothetical protein PoB_001019500 [Plakobranchus ocellatus]
MEPFPSEVLDLALVINIMCEVFSQRRFRQVCYFTNWSCDLLEPEAHFCLRHIDGTLCTHVVYAFANIDTKFISLTPSRVDDKDRGNITGRYIRFNHLLKNTSQDVKTLLSVGGHNESGSSFEIVSRTTRLRTIFAHQCALYLRRWGFDGLDIDWEYPEESNKEHLTLLLRALRLEFKDESIRTGRQELILSLAAPVSRERVKAGYGVREISKELDMINLMTYDYHGAWSNLTGFNSPLYARSRDARFSPEHSVEWSVDHWIALGAQPDKINLGIAGYGQSYTLKGASEGSRNVGSLSDLLNMDSSGHTTESAEGVSTQRGQRLNETESRSSTKPVTSSLTATAGVGSAAVGPGEPGRLRHLSGQLSYPEICELISAGGHVTWDQEQRVPSVTCDDQWVGFDNKRSIMEKVTWAVHNGLGGIMFWSLDLDDFKGDYCGQGRYPLLTAINMTVNSLTVKPESFLKSTSQRTKDNSSRTAKTEISTGFPMSSSHMTTCMLSPEHDKKEEDGNERTKKPDTVQRELSTTIDQVPPVNQSISLKSKATSSNLSASTSNYHTTSASLQTGLKLRSENQNATVPSSASKLAKSTSNGINIGLTSPLQNKALSTGPALNENINLNRRSWASIVELTKESNADRSTSKLSRFPNDKQSAKETTEISLSIESSQEPRNSSVSETREMEQLSDVYTDTVSQSIPESTSRVFATNNTSGQRAEIPGSPFIKAFPISATSEISTPSSSITSEPHNLDKRVTDTDSDKEESNEITNDYYYYIAFRREFGNDLPNRDAAQLLSNDRNQSKPEEVMKKAMSKKAMGDETQDIRHAKNKGKNGSSSAISVILACVLITSYVFAFLSFST